MAYASVNLQSLRTATVQRPASLILRSVDRSAVRTRLPCGCSTHNHTCQRHAVISAHAGRQGSAPAGMSTASTPTTLTRCSPASLLTRGVNGQARRAPCVSTAFLSAFPCQLPAESTPSCTCRTPLMKQLQQLWGPGSSTTLYDIHFVPAPAPCIAASFFLHPCTSASSLYWPMLATLCTCHGQVNVEVTAVVCGTQGFQARFNLSYDLQVRGCGCQVVHASSAEAQVEDSAQGELLI